MAEFGIFDQDPSRLFAGLVLHSRPALIFLGDLFEYDAKFMRIKNLFTGTDSN